MSTFKIFLTYIKIGALAFGGGYVMLPLIENEFVKNLNVIEAEEVYELFSLSQTMPGIVAVNMAVFLGHRLRGVKGALAGAIGVMLPSIAIITVIAAFFDRFVDLPWVQSIFRGLNIAVLAIIAQALWKMAKSGIKDICTLSIFLLILAANLITGLNPVIFAVAGVFAGLLFAERRNPHA